MLADLTSRVNEGWLECVSQRGIGSWRGVSHSTVPQPGCVQCDGGGGAWVGDISSALDSLGVWGTVEVDMG